MVNFKGKIILFGVIMIIFSFLLINFASHMDASSSFIGAKAPDFTLKNLKGETVQLAKVYKKNKATLVYFWATWCPPCRMEIPEFVSFYKEYREKGVELLAVNLRETKDKVNSLKRAVGMNFPILLDTNGKAGNLYKVNAIPATFIIDSKGIIVDVIIGATSKTALKAKIKKLIGEKK